MVLLSAFASDGPDGQLRRLKIGEGLVGQCAAEKRRMLIGNLPENTIPIRSGLFEAVPRNVIVLPVLFEDRVKAVIELASLGTFTASHLAFLEQLTASIGIVLNSIEATMQTEGLLKQSQQLATELQTQQKELQQTNEQLAQKAQQLAEQNVEVERKNQEIEQARRALEEKAKELALTSKYKSEFLANMSHELRTPLNSILVLGQQLTDNPDGNLSARQVEFARTIHGAGTDLLNLISDILDLSKIESGTVSVDAEEVFFASMLDMVGRPFRHEAENRQLSFEVHTDPHLTRSLVTDSKRLQQVLKNLLSNAFKFTEHGGVQLAVSVAPAGGARTTPSSAARPPLLPSRFPIPVSASHRRSSGSSSRLFSRPMPAPAANTAEPVWGWRSAANWPVCWVAKSSCAAHREGQHVHSVFAANLCWVHPRPRLPWRNVERVRCHASCHRFRWNSRSSVSRTIVTTCSLTMRSCLSWKTIRTMPAFWLIVARQGFQSTCCHGRRRGTGTGQEFHPTAVSLDVFLPDMLGWTVLNHLKQDPPPGTSQSRC